MLNAPHPLEAALVARYGHLLPDTLIRTVIGAAGGPQVADADVAALAHAVLRAPATARL